MTLYPHLINLPVELKRVLLLPDTPPLRPAMAAAVHAAGVTVHSYTVGRVGMKPKIGFKAEFLALCQNHYSPRSLRVEVTG